MNDFTTHTMNDSDRPTVREAARRRMSLDGPDAQGLEHALTQVERELAAANAEIERLRAESRLFAAERRILELRDELAECKATLARVEALYESWRDTGTHDRLCATELRAALTRHEPAKDEP